MGKDVIIGEIVGREGYRSGTIRLRKKLYVVSATRRATP
jgi:hypothetical protein